MFDPLPIGSVHLGCLEKEKWMFRKPVQFQMSHVFRHLASRPFFNCKW
jgi:hypothetical protein